MMGITWVTLGDPFMGLIVGIPYHCLRGITMTGHEFLWSKYVKWGLRNEN